MSQNKRIMELLPNRLLLQIPNFGNRPETTQLLKSPLNQRAFLFEAQNGAPAKYTHAII